MAYADGWAALRLECPDRVPRTEYSAEGHWDLIHAVTGVEVDAHSERARQDQAAKAFMKAWDYGMRWSVLTHNQIFGQKRTRMGHAEYAAGAVDFDGEIYQLFDDPEDVYDYDASYPLSGDFSNFLLP